MSEHLDEIDIKILNLLQHNARQSYAEIGRKIDVNEATIRFRVNKLIENQIITRFTTLLNPRKIGLQITGIFLGTIKPENVEVTFERLSNLNEFRHIFEITGKYDFLAVANVSNIEQLSELKKKIKIIENIEDIEVLATTKLIKIDPGFKL